MQKFCTAFFENVQNLLKSGFRLYVRPVISSFRVKNSESYNNSCVKKYGNLDFRPDSRIIGLFLTKRIMSENTESVNEWLSIKEAALKLCVSPSAISHALAKHPEVMTEETKFENNRRYISQKGLILLSAFREKFHGNQHKEANEHVLTVQKESRKALVKGTLQTSAEYLELMKDPVIALRMSQLQMEKRIEALEQRTEPQLLLEQRIDDYLDPSKRITASQQKMLSERVKGLAYGLYGSPTGAHFAAVWNGLHNYTGKKAVSEYTMEDYDAARHWLRKKYKGLNLDW